MTLMSLASGTELKNYRKFVSPNGDSAFLYNRLKYKKIYNIENQMDLHKLPIFSYIQKGNPFDNQKQRA